jgi:chromosome segregation ATPase
VTGDCCNAGITLSEAKTEIRCLYEQIAHLKRDSRNKIVRQMRKHKQAALQVKDLEEKLQKAEADRHNVEENLGEKLRAKIERLEEVERSLGHRSSYASQAAESARALVEMTEGQKRQLESQLKRLTKENIDIQFQLQTMVQNSNVLTTEVEYLRDRAHEEARTTVEADMDAFRKEVSRLEEEKRQLQFELEETQKSSRRERVARQQVEEKLETLEQKVLIN